MRGREQILIGTSAGFSPRPTWLLDDVTVSLSFIGFSPVFD
jgi:hypothetical protein